MGPNSDTGKGTLYINGEPLAEVGEIKIPLEVEPSDLPPILANVSFTITMDCPRWLRRKLAWCIFKARLKYLIHRIFHFLKLTFKKTTPPKSFRGWGWNRYGTDVKA